MRRSLIVSLAGLCLVAAVGCGSSYKSPAPAPSPTPAPTPSPTPAGMPVSIQSGAETLGDKAYSPNPINVAVGGSVTWTNTDKVAHTSSGDAGGWNSGSIAPGGSFTATFSTAGSFTYHCAIHPGMIGTVTVQ